MKRENKVFASGARQMRICIHTLSKTFGTEYYKNEQ